MLQVRHDGGICGNADGERRREALQELRHGGDGVVVESALQELDAARCVVAGDQVQFGGQLLAVRTRGVNEGEGHHLSAILAQTERRRANALDREGGRRARRVRRRRGPGECGKEEDGEGVSHSWSPLYYRVAASWFLLIRYCAVRTCKPSPRTSGSVRIWRPSSPWNAACTVPSRTCRSWCARSAHAGRPAARSSWCTAWKGRGKRATYGA